MHLSFFDKICSFCPEKISPWNRFFGLYLIEARNPGFFPGNLAVG